MENPPSRGERRLIALVNILFILLPLAFFLLLCLGFRARSTPDATLVYTVRLRPVREEYAAEVAVGDRLLDSVQKCEIGEVVSFSRGPAVTETYDSQEKRMKRTPYPGYETITLTVRAEARTRQGGYQIGPFLLYRGQKLHLRLPHLVASGFCTDIQAQTSP